VPLVVYQNVCDFEGAGSGEIKLLNEENANGKLEKPLEAQTPSDALPFLFDSRYAMVGENVVQPLC
jgi:hypothetical protein